MSNKVQERNLGPLMFLSLFLLLLAFFILLNALSNIKEANFQKVLTHFNGNVSQVKNDDIVEQVVVSNFGPAPTAPEVLESSKTLWLSAIPIAKIDTVNKGERLMVEIPYNDVFVLGTSDVRADRVPLFNNITTSISQQFEGVEIAIDIRMYLSDFLKSKPQRLGESDVNPTEMSLDLQSDALKRRDLVINTPSSQMDDEISLGVQRAISLSRTFLSSGVDAKNITTGIIPTDDPNQKLLKIQFYIREVDRTNLTLESLIQKAK